MVLVSIKILGESMMMQPVKRFDKTAKLLGWIIPSGAALSKLSEQRRCRTVCIPAADDGSSWVGFWFSGLKTFAANTIRSQG